MSYRSGALSLSEEDLSIGGGAPTGLSLHRNYNSGVTGIGPGANWTFNADGYVSIEALPLYPGDVPVTGNEPYVYNVVIGGKTIGFLGGSVYGGPNGPFAGGPVGTYQPALPSGAQLVFNGSNPFTGNYTFTDSDGSVANFSPGPSGRITNLTMPDGTRLEYTYISGQTVKFISSNRGWALLFESATKVCAVNLAQSYVTAGSTCPADAQSVTYGTVSSTYTSGAGMPLLTSATRGNQTTTYTYNAKDHLNCVRDPGQAVCKIQTTYTECPNDPNGLGIQYQLHLRDYVSSQQDATGKAYAFSYANGSAFPAGCPKGQQDPNEDFRAFTASTATMTENGSASTVVTLDPSGMPSEIADPLGRKSSFGLEAVSGPWGSYILDTTIKSVARPEGNYETYAFDARGNITGKTVKAKPGSGLADLVTGAVYPASCGNTKTCNKPTSVTDPRSNATSYTYDATHGGVLTETAPADANGIQAVKRYAYAQRYAWIKNASGGFSQAASPVWLLSEERSCRATATVGNACAGGAADEVIVAYDYGPSTGSVGNNLLLRGKTVTAQDSDGAIRSLRTCYGYDRDGNKIWETSPRAGLAACY
ncbi:hypothetical protein [Sphingomonas kyeonggiensis]|uniref:YD repeat-containing protein n=1 Tax=Sphingomonas kyeonggiensis TaxID=1268553 RepID=A0A7W6NXD0_9SPHN|nr:hypothetical protein [Sphingomonas kyeonggiensis]MBB4100054.1 YD repeat-containing protein [Sphingomonas kyeonggiensis]